jgi:hypothetical protein
MTQQVVKHKPITLSVIVVSDYAAGREKSWEGAPSRITGLGGLRREVCR